MSRIGRPPTPPVRRFMAKVRVVDSGCWEWQSTLINGLYGQFWDGRRQVYAHRWSYEHHVSPIPAGLQIDHLCRNTRCVNPDHLEPVTPRENTLRGSSIVAANAVKTHCRLGHPLAGENLLVLPRGRGCRACRLDTYRRYRLRKKEAAA